MRRLYLVCCLLVTALIPQLAVAQQSAKSTQPAQGAASPEMDRLAKAIGGDWNTAESMEKSAFFPNGWSRHGRAQIRLVAGGTSLFAEFHSNGSAGKLDGLYLIWWDKAANIYRFFVCFNDSQTPCKLRGTAHWKGDTFVNDYKEEVDGKMTKWRDSFIRITPNSHSLVAHGQQSHENHDHHHEHPSLAKSAFAHSLEIWLGKWALISITDVL